MAIRPAAAEFAGGGSKDWVWVSGGQSYWNNN
jgi:hypothetical protein